MIVIDPTHIDLFFFFSSRRRHTRLQGDWSSDVCSSDLHFDANPARFAQGERVRLRHVLFAVTPGVDVRALTQRAEALLIELRCADDAGLRFAEAARQWSKDRKSVV